MTLPRSVVPGSTYLLGRRCTQRQYFLRPDPKTRAIFEYCLAEAAAQFGIVVHSWIMMSNHYHSVVTDPHGRIPDFMQRLHHLLAKSLNVRWGRWENLWSAEAVCLTRLVEASDIDDKIAYVLANAVADHLVERASDWPGSSSWFLLDGRRRKVRRPVGFFREAGPMAREVTLAVGVPAHVQDPIEWAERIRQVVKAKEQAAREERRKTGRRVLGAKAARRVSAFSRPNTTEPRRNLRPHIACRSEGRRISELEALGLFRKRYAHSLQRFVMGERDVGFPFGTFEMMRLGAVILPAPA